ncbi:MAG: Hpt domain-containing protein [Sedimenticola sp.]|nr:Hpt domain-containing protein [Sedimenticola sp.]
MSEARDHSALKWIKAELDSSLEKARHALEAYVDEAGPETELDSCISNLHQVRGTLQLIQLYGGAMLAEEMELVANALKGLGEQKKRESAEALMVGLAQLPDYLEQIESGASDMPLLLLPLMNELRAARDASLLSELALFSPNLDEKLKAADGSEEGNPELPKLARKLRLQYHKALLDWYRDIDAVGGLERIANLFKTFEESAWTKQVRQFFQVAQSSVRALHEGALDSGIATKLLVGKVDREIKRIIDEGELAVAEAPANDLIKNLLYYTASADSNNPVVQQVKQDFGLDGALFSKADQSGDQSSLHAPGRELLDSLRSAISADLTAIKDQLDLFIRSKSSDLTRLQAQQEPLKKLADTLGMVGQGELRSRLMRQADKITELVEAESYPDEQDLMAMASDILFIETSLENLSVVRRYVKEEQDGQVLSSLPAGEFERLVDSVMHEAGIDMARNKEAILNYIEQPENKALLQDVPRRFNGIAGAFSVLTLTDAAELMGRLNNFVEQNLLGDKAVPDVADLDLFADAVTGIEYYMEAVTEGRGIHPEILEVTRNALAELRVPELTSNEPGEPSNEAEPELEQQDLAEEIIEPVESAALLELASDEAEPQPEPAQVRTPSAEKPALEDIDPEILEIFIEEAEEELAVIEEYLPRWRDNRDDSDALTTFRRSFHTLKGSGRLVGAKTIGEYAWSLENLLNRVIDETVEASPDVIAVLMESIRVLPELIESQKQGTLPDIDVQPLIARAEALSKPGAVVEGDELPSAENQLNALENEIDADESIDFSAAEDGHEITGQEEETEEAEPVMDSMDESEVSAEEVQEIPEPAPITMDETLLEIFEAESQTHIETLSHFYDACSESPLACRIDRELVRALHTLHGSAEMAGVDSIAQVSTALEAMTSQLNGLGRPADEAALNLIDRSVELFKTTLGSINVPGAVLPDWRELIDEIHQYRRDPELVPEPEEDTFTESETVAEEIPTQPENEIGAESALKADDNNTETNQEWLAVPEGVVDLSEVNDIASESEGKPSTDGDEIALVELTDEVVTSSESDEIDEVGEIEIALDEVLAAEESEVEAAVSSSSEEIEEITDSLAESEADDLPEEIPSDIESEALSSEAVPVVSQADDDSKGYDAPVMVELEGDPELVDIFLEEARELLESLESTLQTGNFNLSDKKVSEELQRTLHTLKGGARLAGAIPIGDLSHGFESLLTAVDQERIQSSEALTSLTHEVIDRLAEQIDDLAHEPKLRSADDLVLKLEQWLKQGGEPEPEPESQEIEVTSEPVTDEAESPVAELDETEISPALEAEPAEAALTSDEPIDEPGVDAVEDQQQTAVDLPQIQSGAEAALSIATDDESRTIQSASRGQREQVRVRSDLLDRLVNYAGEVSIYRTRIEQQNGQLGFNLTELEQTISRLREQLRQLEIETEAQILFRYEHDRGEEAAHDAAFDPLELDRFSAMQQVSRSLMETVNDLSNINGFLEDLQSESDTLLLQQSRITTDLQDGLMRTRMVPFAQIVPRLHRVVRQTCNQLDKKADLVIRGEGSEIDRGILERMIGPLEHILRNAIAHGIETPAQRRESGKSESGTIRLDLSREGSDIQLVISDDGAGVNMAKIREQAIKSGLLDPNAEVADTDVLPFVLEHGFSTAQEITQISGRGVGLDVVVSEVKQLGGSLDITSQPGEGAKFIILLPLTLAITDALLVELTGEIYAIPHTSIEGVVRVSLQELEACYSGKQSVYNYAGQDYQVRYLGSMLNVGQLSLSDQRKWYPLLLVRAGEHHVALQVDGLLGNRQIVVKSVGIQVATVRWISGGTILGDGRVALILDVTALVRSDAAHSAAPKPELAKVEVSSPEPGVGRTVMVVDDSITVRKVTGRLLERHGMNVITAKDGVDAVATLQEQRPDIMLLDIEMPRMDGYELARHMRNSDALKAIPIIMITSRTGDKHRNLAMELGVKRYLGKPYQENELLDNIYSVLGEEVK